jgi:hypothetical protein
MEDDVYTRLVDNKRKFTILYFDLGETYAPTFTRLDGA